MSRRGSAFVCRDCGHTAPRWLGRCPACGGWNTMVEEAPPSDRDAATSAVPMPLAAVPLEDGPRLSTGSNELDRVLGGGLMPASLTLVGGDPGIGKSTLVLQCGFAVAATGTVLYVSGEESAHQLRQRADRLGPVPDGLLVASETDLAAVEQYVLGLQPVLLIVDSIQTTRTPELSTASGSVAQIREGAARLLRLAKTRRVAVLIVGHVTKEGVLAGPRVLEHIVDTVLYFEGDLRSQFRVLRAVKNRFGNTNEIGLFEMRDSGLRDVPDASRVFLAERPVAATGSVVVPTVEGTRPLLVEVQALVGRSSLVPPRRTADGIDQKRVHLLLAVLEKRAGLSLGTCDAYVRVAGGLSVDEPAVDLAVALALASSFRDQPADPRAVVLGEVGLAGEVRAVSRIEQRLREAEKMGFERAVLPRGNLKAIGFAGSLRLAAVDTVTEALASVVRPRAPRS